MIARLFFTLCLLLLFQTAFGAKAIDIDKNKDGIIQRDEYSNFIRNKNSPPLSQYDLNDDGKLDLSELSAAQVALEKLEKEVRLYLVEFKQDYPNGQPIAEFARVNKTDDKDSFSQPKKSKVMVRKSYEDVRIGTGSKKPSLAGPAEIQFTSDKKNDNKILVLRGTIMYPVEINQRNKALVVPSMTINRVTNDKEKTKEVNSLIFRVGGDWEFMPQNADIAYFRLNPAWTTDTRFNLDIRGIDAQFEPVWLNLGQHSARKLGAFGYKWRGFIQAEYGRVHDSDGRKDLVEDESFSRLGGNLSLTVWPEAAERLSFDFNYLYMWKIGGDLRDRKLFKGSIEWKVDSEGHFKLITSYINGDSSVALEDEETWSIGLGVQF